MTQKPRASAAQTLNLLGSKPGKRRRAGRARIRAAHRWPPVERACCEAGSRRNQPSRRRKKALIRRQASLAALVGFRAPERAAPSTRRTRGSRALAGLEKSKTTLLERMSLGLVMARILPPTNLAHLVGPGRAAFSRRPQHGRYPIAIETIPVGLVSGRVCQGSTPFAVAKRGGTASFPSAGGGDTRSSSSTPP